MNRISIPVTIAAAFFVASSAAADQYVAKIDAPFQGASAELLDALKIVEIDIFEHGGEQPHLSGPS